MTQKPIRVGLIGTGRIGEVHAIAINSSPDAELSWVADPHVEGARSIAERFGGKATNSAEEVIASGEVDAILVASPTPTHIDMIDAAIDAGLPVFCEKPIDRDIDRVNWLRPKVAATDVPVMIGFNRRFDPHFKSARSRMLAGEIGALEQLSIISRDPAPPHAEYVKVSGGIFRDMTIHDFDMARFFVPDITEVFATGSCLFDDAAKQYGDLDTVMVTMRSATGVLINITNSRHSSVGYDQRIEAFGGGGQLMVANMPTSLVSLSGAQAVEAKSPYQNFFLQRYEKAFAAELRTFIALLRGEDVSYPTYEDGRAALLLADAAERSVAEGRSVTVQWD